MVRCEKFKIPVKDSMIILHKVTVSFLAALVDCCFIWSFCLQCNPSQVAPLPSIPVHDSRMSHQTILFHVNTQSQIPSADSSQTKKKLTSQNMTMPGFHRTLAWKSTPKAMCSYRKLSSMSLSSFLYPTMLRVTIPMSIRAQDITGMLL